MELSEIITLGITALTTTGVGAGLGTRLARTKESKGLDITSITKNLADTFEEALKTTTMYYGQVIERMEKDRITSDERQLALELKLEKMGLEREGFLQVISGVHNCELLKKTPSYVCPVVKVNLGENNG